MILWILISFHCYLILAPKLMKLDFLLSCDVHLIVRELKVLINFIFDFPVGGEGEAR